MELFLFICYLLLAVIFKPRVMIVALLAFTAMHFVVDLPIPDYLVHIVYILCVLPIESYGNIRVKISCAIFSIYQWFMAIDYIKEPLSKTVMFYSYDYVSFSLHVLIILSLINRGLIDGFNHTRIYDTARWLLNSKLNLSHNKINTGR